MSEKTNIEWCDSTFNPWIGCTKVSPACDHCYAERQDARGVYGGTHWGPGVPRKRTSEANWRKPMQWNKNAHRFCECEDCGWRGEHQNGPFACAACGSERVQIARRRVFCASLADVFDNEVPAEWRRDLFALIEATPNIDWLVLTKRIGNVSGMVPAPWVSKPFQHGPDPSNIYPAGWPANVWLGATICNQKEADHDIPKLLAVPAAVRFLSIEPMLGPVDLEALRSNGKFGEGQPWLHPLLGVVSDGHGDTCSAPGIDWIIAGGESGPQARPSHPDWFRGLRDQCKAAGVPFLFKQWGEWLPWSQFTEARIDDPPEQTRFATMEWAENGWRDVGRPDIWDSKDGLIDDMQCSGRVGKSAAGRLLDGVEHNGYPELINESARAI